MIPSRTAAATWRTASLAASVGLSFDAEPNAASFPAVMRAPQLRTARTGPAPGDLGSVLGNQIVNNLVATMANESIWSGSHDRVRPGADHGGERPWLRSSPP